MPLHGQLIRFALVGITGTLVQYSILGAAGLWPGLSPAIASCIGFMLGAMINYVLNYFFTFKSGKPHLEAATKYFSVIGVGLFFTAICMTVFVHHFGWGKWTAQVLTTLICFCWHFVGSHCWAFKHSIPLSQTRE